MPPLPAYRRHTIYTGQPSERTLCLVGDLNRDGIPEIVVGARNPQAELLWLGRAAGVTDGPWQAHRIDDGFGSLESGGVLFDVDGDGDLDLIAGQDYQGDRLFWWECPDDPAQPWARHEIVQMPANQSHNQLVADVDGDGRPELYFWNQRADALCGVPIPDDPQVSPWPGVFPVATGVREEGLATADLDGDGRSELIAGCSWYRPPSGPGGAWERHVFAEGYVAPQVVAADFDG
ncbi:MAG: FG-GAP repeat domain-containing protein, partial [Chloroflexota bacterium]